MIPLNGSRILLMFVEGFQLLACFLHKLSYIQEGNLPLQTYLLIYLFQQQLFISFILYSNQHTQFRKTVEINRNYCLIFGFTIFIFLTDVPWLLENSQACTAVTFLGHYIWLSAFTWTCMIFLYYYSFTIHTVKEKIIMSLKLGGTDLIENKPR